MAERIYIDCGAHGGVTMAAALAVGNYDRAIAFEPNPAALFLPQWKAVLADERATLVEAAVWVAHGRMNLYREPRRHYENFGDSQGSTLMPGKTTGGVSYDDGFVEVETIDFAEWLIALSEGGGIDIDLKMDIEGAEYEVLPRCMDMEAFKCVSKMRIEFHGEKISFNGWEAIENEFRAYCAERSIELVEADH